MDYEVLNLLETELGSFVKKSKGNYAFSCPFCNHPKKKLEIHINTSQWNCWVCGTAGHSLTHLFKKIGASSEKIKKIHELTADKIYIKKTDAKILVELPKEYIPLWKLNDQSIMYNMALNYILSRGVTIYDILKYRIGYCTEGKYKDMIIFPNYDENGNLTYFTTRTFRRGREYNKFINPPFERNIVGFEMQVNWNLPIILVESALDAIILKRNAIPLYGTQISKKLYEKIIQNKVKTIYLSLDRDAIKKSIKYIQYFMMNDINVFFINFEDNKDTNELGYDIMWEKINSAKKLSEMDLLNLKLNQIIDV